jgi:urease accessory protein
MPTDGIAGSLEAGSLRLWQLISPALPVGAFAWSDGLEFAVGAGWVSDETTAGEWILGQLQHAVARLDVPVYARLCAACENGDEERAQGWNRWLLASRGTMELRAADRHMGAALKRLLDQLEVRPGVLGNGAECAFASQFARACVQWGIPVAEGAKGYLWAWSENQVSAAVKLVPLGQSAGQRLLMQAGERIPVAVARGLDLDDEDIGALAPSVTMGSARHETKYSRLFRS